MRAKKTQIAWTAALLLSLAACGGGGGDGNDASTPPTGGGGGGGGAPTLSISGTAATGAAIAGGTVDVKCAAGTGTPATTAANGSYTATVSGGTLPCVLKITSGSTVLHSIVASAPSSGGIVANITPLTELLVANVAGGAPETLFTTFDAAAQARVTPSAVTAAISTTLAALQGTVDLTGVNPLSDTLVAANGGTAGNALDAILDALATALANSQTTLEALSTAVATSTPTTPPVLQQIAASATSCTALRSGKYRVINPHETANDTAYAAYRLAIDATALKITDAEPSHTEPDSTTLVPIADTPCGFTYQGEFGTETALVSPSGVIVVQSPSSTGPLRTSMLVPEQAIALSQLAGAWNYIAYVRDGASALTPSNGTAVLDDGGKFTAGSECAGLVCTDWAAADLPSALVVNPLGGFDIAGQSGGTARAFAFKNAKGVTSLFVLDPNEGGLSVFTQQVARTLPAVDAVNKFWDLTVGSGSFKWAPTNGGGVTAASSNTTTVTAIDTAAQTFTRIRASDQRIDTRQINAPRPGMDFRAAGTSSSTSGTVNLSATIIMPIPGSGLTFSSSTASNQNFFNISVNQP